MTADDKGPGCRRETEPVATRRRAPRPVPDTPSGLSSICPRKSWKRGCTGWDGLWPAGTTASGKPALTCINRDSAVRDGTAESGVQVPPPTRLTRANTLVSAVFGRGSTPDLYRLPANRQPGTSVAHAAESRSGSTPSIITRSSGPSQASGDFEANPCRPAHRLGAAGWSSWSLGKLLPGTD